MPSDVRDRSPSPYSRRAAAASSSHRSRSPRRHSSRSRSPAEGHRYRSRSPRPRSPPQAEEAKSKKKLPGGFKFKEKPKGDNKDERDRDQIGRGLERGYRDRGADGRSQLPAQSHDPIAEKFGSGASVKDKFGDVKVPPPSTAAVDGQANDDTKKEKKKKDKNKASTAQPMMEMIIVYVNDRLGTRAEIKCASSDTIKDFKAFVAHKIGRKPHEIMIKRQGERPFKDQLTLEDYSVGNGVQLDLELDTGD